MIRIVLVEDHASFGQALAGMAAMEPDLEVVGQVGRGEDALTSATGADIAVVDLDLPGMAGVATIAALRERHPGLGCVVLTALTDEVELGRAVEAGAAGVLHKSVSMADLFRVVRAVAAGENTLDPADSARWLRALADDREAGWRARVAADALSPRELEVLTALARGERLAGIARSMAIAPGTVQTHIRNIRQKLGVSSQLEAVVEAYRLGLIDRPG